MIRLRASTFALPPSRFRLRASAFALRATADKPRYGGQAALRRTSRATADRSSFGDTGLSRIRRTIRVVVLTPLAVLIGGAANVFACPVCFGAEETGMIDGAKLGVLVLLGITLLVQGGFVAFFLYLRRHARRNADIELDSEWVELQRGPRTS